MELYERKNYTNDVPYIFNAYIREYDIVQANINILLYKNIISKEEYNKLRFLSKKDRQISIGYILKDENINRVFEEGLKEIRRMFIESNNLNECDILSIKNDAIYVITKVPKNTCFGNVEFICKNIYTSYIRLLNLEMYYKWDRQSQSEGIDIKGINDAKLPLHGDYMIDIIMNMFYYINNGYYAEATIYIEDIFAKYVKKLLPIGYYRTFDSMSSYTINVGGRKYGLNSLSNSKENIDIVDISYNGNLLRELWGIVKQYSISNL